MNFMTYLANKAIPNFLIWLIGYLAINAVSKKNAELVKQLDWSALIDWNSLACLAIGSIVTIIIGWLVAKKMGAPIFQAVRDECSSAITTAASIGLVTSIFQTNLVFAISALVAYGIAWRLP